MIDMRPLSLYLLGPYHVAQDGEPITEFRSDKVRALLAYLAVEADGPHRRDALAGLLWPDVPDRTARKNLRLSLHRLRDTLHDLRPESAYFRITRETIQVRPAAVWVDAIAFSELIAASYSHDHRHVKICPACVERLTEAAQLYRGDFLQGFFLDDCLAFSEWVLLKREMVHRQVLSVLYHLAEYHRRRGELERARTYAMRQLELEPWREEAHRQLMDILARSGETCAALAQFETCRHALAAELDIEPDEETVKLYERIRAMRGRPYHNLPPQATPFVGRGDELASIADLLTNPDCRLLTILGPGGIGKSRLAIRAAQMLAAEQARRFLEGVVYVPLVGVESPAVLPSTIAKALGFAFHGPTAPARQLIEHLREKEMLLLLDNFEHLLDGTNLLVELLYHAPQVKLLVASRERLNVPWEWVLPLQGLSYPEEDEAQKQRVSSETYDAVRLFLMGAHRVQPDFRLEGESESAVVRICQTVAGMPLGVELAAARVGGLPVADIATEIARNLSFSAAAMRHLPARHRSLRAVFDHTWDTLTDEERLVFAQLSVFRGGFTREAALAVISHQSSVISDQSTVNSEQSTVNSEQSSVISGQTDNCLLITDHCSLITDHWLSSLVDKSLLRLLPSGRYEMHEMLRQYAAEKLAALPNVQTMARDRHCAYYAAFLHRRETGLVREGAAETLAALKAEIANVRTAWRWAVKQARIRELGHSLDGLARYYLLVGPFQEGEMLIGMAVDRVRALVEKTHEPARDAQILLSRLLTEQARLLSGRGMYDQAIAAVQTAIDLARTHWAAGLEAAGFLQWGRTLWRWGDYGAARTQLQQALALARAASIPKVEADSLHSLGVVAFNEADYREARSLFEQALRSYQEVGSRRAEGMALGNIGLLFNRLGDYSGATTYYQEALCAFQEIGDRQCEGLTHSNLGLLAHRQGDDTAAEEFSQQALDIAQEIGDRFLEGYALTHLGDALAGLGHLDEAADAYRKAVNLRRDLHEDNRAMESLAGLARVSLARGDLTQAQAQVEEVLAHLEAHRTPTGLAQALEGMDEPFQVLLTCYRVLCAGQDPRAQQLLNIAYGVLREQASRMGDGRLRRSFLENVPAHREIVAEVEKLTGEGHFGLPDKEERSEG